jgi:hypothetical protein
LQSDGWVRVSDETHPESFGNRLVVFYREPVTLRLVRDRGQWSADVLAHGWDENQRVLFPLLEGSGSRRN